MASIQFTGLGTGIDTKSIIDQLIAVSRAPITAQETRRDRETTRKSNLDDLQKKLLTLKSAADGLRDPLYWNGTPKAVSGDEASYGITATAGSAKASYAIQVKRLATSDVWMQAATAGQRQLGSLYSGANTFATTSTKLVGLTSNTGTSLGLAAGQTLTLSGTMGGSAISSTLAVTATTTVDDLRGFVQTAVPGGDVRLGAGGRLEITSPIGTDQEVTALSLSTSGAAPLFDAAFASSTATRAAAGLGKVQANDTLTVTAGTVAFDVAVTAGMTMAEVAAAINSAQGPATAAVAGGRLRVAGAQTGAANQVTVTSVGSAATNLGLASVVDAQDAIVNVDGADLTTASNESTDVIPGATLSLRRTSTAATSATTDPTNVDGDEGSRRVQAFVDAYNSVMTTINSDVTEKSVRDPKTRLDQMKGTLYASSALNTIRSSLRGAMMDTVSGLSSGRSLAKDVGLGTAAFGTGGAAALTGELTFDPAKLKSLFDQDKEAVRAIFASDGSTSAGDGLAQRISDMALSFTRSDGPVRAAMDGSDEEVKRINDQIDRMERRVTSERTRLEAQFLAMERIVSQLNSNSSNALAQLGQSSSG